MSDASKPMLEPADNGAMLLYEALGIPSAPDALANEQAAIPTIFCTLLLAVKQDRLQELADLCLSFQWAQRREQQVLDNILIQEKRTNATA